MHRKLILIVLGAALGTGTAALGSDHCERPMRDWKPREAATAKALELGIDVSRIRTDDGCYTIHGRAADGRAVEITMDPVTLTVLNTEYQDKPQRKDRRQARENGRRANAPSPAPQPPANPLIGPASGVTQ
jgi:hypothetical protein